MRSRKRITPQQAAQYLEKLRRLPISGEPLDPNTIFALPDLADRYALTNYDAAYLDLAIHRTIPLATTDAALQRAARMAGIDLVKAL
jgi:predicted nucleic acid-binding protein